MSKNERTLVIIKPDGVERKFIGEVIQRFEKGMLIIKAIKILNAPQEILEKHYIDSEEYLRNLGQKSLKTYKEYGIDPISVVGTGDDLEIGRYIRKWLVDFMMSGPIIPMVLEGNHAVDSVRKIAGNTIPIFADAGTIRGDLSCDSPDLANIEKRAVANIIHASGTKEEAESEINLWFSKDEILD